MKLSTNSALETLSFGLCEHADRDHAHYAFDLGFQRGWIGN